MNHRYPLNRGLGPCRWEDNIKKRFRKTEFEAVNYIHMVHNNDQWQAVANTNRIWVP
jgi:hypothetical protein